jgi:putative NIF3 family GTP cyclohydrolase 1 type 2
VRTLTVARPAKAPSSVRSIAVAAGAGASVLRGSGADVWITGELSHHDALAAVAAGTSVVLAGHSNTERGFLPVLRRRLAESFDGDLDVRVAKSDRDPFVVV